MAYIKPKDLNQSKTLWALKNKALSQKQNAEETEIIPAISLCCWQGNELAKYKISLTIYICLSLCDV